MVSLFHVSLADGSVGVSLCGLNLHFLPNKILYLFIYLCEVPVYAFYWAVVQLLSCVQLFATLWTAAYQASLFFTVSQSLLKLMSIGLMMPAQHFILCLPLLSCPQSFPASESVPMSRLFASGGQSIGASVSASVLPMNIQC